ncbi:hypothetical protein Kpol_416p3 [Vanderwaltozyma polyspora DSM 70294]|uniref:Flo11 domain-containing protein n=1 Tax=Vanderwaltozyma polyspora (strain ATCC 22028 / DSM 70294 / BCRC 21397 / CBS 2163 / NBRC 10782 / NRRL Y-8283 / UCD 57-17) TaxID=436907 RepID=A7TRL5_VANPO|nr:uncharacterized protein Kpol_416p3 [Vanderwaltozyma polyspora DSM 70294]EDO15088.1 hypothetical protein Kpol_416p3 [Vanderwaltozyma polyspora DSM 70294]
MNNILTSIYLLIFLKFCACAGNYPNGCTLDSRWNTLNCFTTTPWANKFTSTKNGPLSYWTDPRGGRVKCNGHTVYTPTKCTASTTYPSGCTMDTRCGTTLKCYTTTACRENYTYTKCASCNYWTDACGTRTRSCLQTVCTPTTCTVSPTYPSGCTLDTRCGTTLKCVSTTPCKERCLYPPPGTSCNYWTGPCGTKTKSCWQTVCTTSKCTTPIVHPSGCTLDSKYNTLNCVSTTQCKEKCLSPPKPTTSCNYWTDQCGTKTKSCWQTVCTTSKTETPIPTKSKTETPIQTSSEIETPIQTSSEIETPIQTSSEIETPVQTSSEIETPVQTSSEIETPIQTSSEIETPIQTSSEIESPVQTSSEIETPIQTSSEIESPVQTSSEIETPIQNFI